MPKKVDKLFLRELREIWDDVNTAGMTEGEALKFRKQKEAVDMYIDDAPVSEIVFRTGISQSRISQLVNRCATPTDTGEIPGYNALIPGKIMLPSKTKMDIFFEEHPKMGEKIRGTYFGDKAYTSEHRINFRSLHGIFIRECRNAGIQSYEYPFTMKDFGYEALRRYITKVANTEMTKAIKREGKDQRQQFMSTGYGRAITLNPLAPYEQVQADGHILDVIYTVETMGPDGVKITDIATRMWLFAIIDIATRCIIGYSASPHFNYNRFDVLEAIKNSIVPHEHKDFKLKSLSYPDKGGFPSEAIPETKWAVFNTIMLDNAKSHRSKIVMDKLTNELKCVVNFGSVATPETRGIVERFFNTLEGSVHRLAFTTGSNARDPKRKDPEKHAKDVKLTYEDVCEILESLIAQYNNSAHSSLNGYTPMEMMETKIREARMPVYTLPQVDREKIEKLTHYTEECILRGGYRKGKQLRINYMSGVYVAADLMIPQSMANERVLIEVDPSDMRTVKMYRKDGSFFCTMRAVGEKGQIRHSFKTREMSNKAKNKRTTPDTIFTPDMSLLAEELAERGKKDRRSRTKAATIIREAQGGLDPKDTPAEIIDLYPTEDTTPSIRPLQKAVGGNSRPNRELTDEEMDAIYAKYPGNDHAAIMEINRLKKG